MISNAPGQEIARIDFPIAAARWFVFIFFGALGSLEAFAFARVLQAPDFGVPRGPFLVTFGAFAAMTILGFAIALFVVGRRPTAMIVRQDGLVVRRGAAAETIPWNRVTGVDQHAVRRIPTYVVLFAERPPLAFGLGQRAQDFARHIARLADLVWIDEPFKARKRG